MTLSKIVYLLQGGGALGAYQLGVCEKLLENNYPPDWLIGTSIGAINASIIAGNKPESRVAKLREFWEKIASPPICPFSFPADERGREWQNFMYTQQTLWFGQPHFFTPRSPTVWWSVQNCAEKISFYDTLELTAVVLLKESSHTKSNTKMKLLKKSTKQQKNYTKYFD